MAVEPVGRGSVGRWILVYGDARSGKVICNLGAAAEMGAPAVGCRGCALQDRRGLATSLISISWKSEDTPYVELLVDGRTRPLTWSVGCRIGETVGGQSVLLVRWAPGD